MKFVIHKRAKGKARPRFCRVGNHVRTYTPASTHAFEEEVKTAFLKQCGNQYDNSYEGAVKVHIMAYFVPNKSLSSKKRNELIGKRFLKKPDGDNIEKSILDPLNGLAWKDDSQVQILHIEKWYAEEDKIEIEIEYIN